MEARPKVGIGVCLIKENKVLLGKRKNAHGEGCWAFPGGHLEYGETWEECAKREVLEETGLEIKNILFVTASNDIFPDEGKHYVTLILRAEYSNGQLQNLEPEKCEEWMWFEWNNLPCPRFASLENILKMGFNPFD